MTSLITTMRNQFLDAIRSVNPPGRWKILVVDEHSQSLLSATLKQYDILEENVSLIESITTYREPQPNYEAVYLLMATTQNVDRVIADFSNGKQQYAGAHLFFIDGLSDQLLDRIASSPAEPYLRGLKDLAANFWPIESQAFSLKMPGMFFSMYGPPRNDAAFKPLRDHLEEELHFAARVIANVCISLNENPYIRYYLPSHHPPLGPLKPNATTRAPPPPEGSSRWRTNLARGSEARAYESADGNYVTRLLAFSVQQLLDEHKKANPDFAKSDGSRPRSTLIITDRSMDTVAPFLHEFTYQAMANDLLPIEDGSKYVYKFQNAVGTEDKVAVISDADTTWTEIRHMHMAEAINKLMADFNQFMVDNAGFKGDGAANLSDMKDMLAGLPQFQEMRERFSLHLNMAQECMTIFERDRLPVIGNVEQNCATGLTAEGKTPKTLVEEMVPLLDSRDTHNSNKVRVIALYIQYRDGVPEEDKRRLYQHARLSLPDQDAVNALVHLGLRISRGPSDKDTKKKLKYRPPKNSKEEEYDLSRYKPLLTNVLEDQFASRLDPTSFPYVKDQPAPPTASSPVAPASSLRSARPVWHRAGAGRGREDNKERVFVFVAGGMTYSEMRECYLVGKKAGKDVYIGSTHAVTPRQFVDDLKVLELNGVGSRALPNGVGLGSQRRKTPQEYYDQKYFIPDAAPSRAHPPPAAAAAAALPSNPKSGSNKLVSSSARKQQQGQEQQHQQLRPEGMGGRTISASSAGSSLTFADKEKEKKKKKGLFHF
ncbi:Sec1-like protein [Cristinia sonorae]|uniref:Sec1-like protein n=1 Tax=Cristinia sonorae TaxID=1940300 RepID=A0A8K0XJU7_9AGAR|nr:Sec1-like protein [Cristinia sonorae]